MHRIPLAGTEGTPGVMGSEWSLMVYCSGIEKPTVIHLQMCPNRSAPGEGGRECVCLNVVAWKPCINSLDQCF